MKTTYKLISAAAILFSTSTACDVTTDVQTPPGETVRALAVIRGTLEGDAASNVQFAIAWKTDAEFGKPLNNWSTSCGGEAPTPRIDTRDSVAHIAQAMFASSAGIEPLAFDVSVTALPPADALVDLSARGGQGMAATGQLVAFIDRDGDGNLTLARPGSASDRVLAVSTSQIHYLDGAHAGEAMLPQGFSVSAEGHSTSLASAEIELRIPTQPDEIRRQQMKVCGEIRTTSNYGGSAPAGAKAYCFSKTDGEHTGYVWMYRGETQDPCVEEFVTNSRCVEKDAPIPAEFPCAIGDNRGQ